MKYYWILFFFMLVFSCEDSDTVNLKLLEGTWEGNYEKTSFLLTIEDDKYIMKSNSPNNGPAKYVSSYKLSSDTLILFDDKSSDSRLITLLTDESLAFTSIHSGAKSIPTTDLVTFKRSK